MGEHRPQDEGMQVLAPEGRQREGVGRVDLAFAQPDRMLRQSLSPGEADPIHVRDRIAAHRQKAELAATQAIEVELARLLIASRHRWPGADLEPWIRGVQAVD